MNATVSPSRDSLMSEEDGFFPERKMIAELLEKQKFHFHSSLCIMLYLTGVRKD